VGEAAGAAIVNHPSIPVISFTGSTETGRVVGETCGRMHKRLSLEMGGKNAMIILDDANLDLALDGAVWGAFGTSGQRCTAASRVIVHRKAQKELEERLPNFKFVAALSDCDEEEDWEGERGLITEVVERCEQELSEMDAYLCGPPPMVDAAIAMIDAKGVPEERVYYDKFTTTAPE